MNYNFLEWNFLRTLYYSGAKLWRDTYGYDFATFGRGGEGVMDSTKCWENCLEADFSPFARRCRRNGGEFKCCMAG